jgi:uncharacterized damage-inducible protein DinB
MTTALENTTLLTTLVRDYVTYNSWANRTVVRWLKNKPAEVMDQIVPSSFPSIKDTLVHIWDTQRFWLAVIQQTPPPPSFRMAGFHGTLEEAFDGILDHSSQFESYVDSLSEQQLAEKIHLATPWFESKHSRFEYIHHTMNHSTYHRGQLITIGRNVGLTDAPMTDFNYYLLVPEEEKKFRGADMNQLAA